MEVSRRIKWAGGLSMLLVEIAVFVDKIFF